MSDDALPKWQTTGSKYIVRDRWLALRADTCVDPAGKTITPWYVLEFEDWVSCLVIDKHGDVILLKHYRHGIDEYVTEIVAGGIESGDDAPLSAVKRELREEIGYQGGQIIATGVSFANPSNQNNRVHSFLAVGGDCSGDGIDELGADFVIEKIPFAQFVANVEQQKPAATYQALHLASIFFGLNLIRKTRDSNSELAKLRRQIVSS